MRPPRRFHVYIMTNGPKAAILYVGMTGDIRRRAWQHKDRLVTGFTGRYNLIYLVYYESFVYQTRRSAERKKSRPGGEVRNWI